MENRMVMFCMVLAIVAIAYGLIAMYQTFSKEYKRRKLAMVSIDDYTNMCNRIKPIEDDVRTNSGDHFAEEVYLKRADYMNQNTRIFELINLQTEFI